MPAFPLDELKKKYSAWRDTPLKVELISANASPYDTAAASARTCYSSKGLLKPGDMRKTEKSREVSDRVARSTLKSGHLTTRQHAHFIFGIDGASRNVIWQVLHSHPYYNSEQVSQRYVPIKSERSWYTLPPELQNNEKVVAHLHHSIATYEKLIEVLTPVVSEIYFGIHRLKARNPEKYAGDIRKRCMEIARYVMPLATNAYLYHTISALTLIRYARMMEHFATPEAAALILQMIEKVVELDPDFLKELPEPYASRRIETDPESNQKRHARFDSELGNSYARLISSSGSIDAILKIAGDTLGRQVSLTDLLHGDRTPFAGDTLYPVSMEEYSRILNQMHFTYQKKLSHTADSQEQRHRTLPGVRPHLAEQLVLSPDYIIPTLLRESSQAMTIYSEFMEGNFSLIKELYSNGVPAQPLTYLLPNAFPIRFIESGDLANFYHKWKARLCYNAQEEIFYSSRDEVLSLRDKEPELYSLLGPPCMVRTSLKPRCPEGDHFCGIKVWQIPLPDMQRKL